jgi:cell division protease FtsH
MSQLGPLAYGGGDEPVFLGRDYAQRSDYSEDTAIRIDREVERIVTSGYERARQVLSEHDDLLEALAKELLDRESIDGQRVYELIEEKTGEDLTPEEPDIRSGLEIGHEAAERSADPATTETVEASTEGGPDEQGPDQQDRDEDRQTGESASGEEEDEQQVAAGMRRSR